jgi:hypothetical protein
LLYKLLSNPNPEDEEDFSLLSAFEIFWNINKTNSNVLEQQISDGDPDLPFAKMKLDCDALAIKPQYIDQILDFCASKCPTFLSEKTQKKVIMNDNELSKFIPEVGSRGVATTWEEFEV